MTKTRVLLALLAVGVLAGGYFVYELIDTDAPDAVSTEAALDELATATTATTTADGADTALADGVEQPAAGDAVVGDWTVDNEFGDFTFDSASGSFAGFRVEKSFFSGQGATAVGRTGEVTGTVTIGDGELSAAEITVDMTQIVSDDSAREGAIKDAVQADAHPTSTFAVGSAVAIDTDALQAGETVSASVVGELTIAGSSNDVAVPIEATIVEPGVALIIGSTELVWADYGIETPTSRVADVADEGILEFQLIVRVG